MTAEEFLGAIADEVGGKVPRIHVPYRALYGAAAVAEWIATSPSESLWSPATASRCSAPTTRCRSTRPAGLGMSPAITLRDGIRLAGSWYRENVLGATAESAAAVSPVTA